MYENGNIVELGAQDENNYMVQLFLDESLWYDTNVKEGSTNDWRRTKIRKR